MILWLVIENLPHLNCHYIRIDTLRCSVLHLGETTSGVCNLAVFVIWQCSELGRSTLHLKCINSRAHAYILTQYQSRKKYQAVEKEKMKELKDNERKIYKERATYLSIQTSQRQK